MVSWISSINSITIYIEIAPPVALASEGLLFLIRSPIKNESRTGGNCHLVWFGTPRYINMYIHIYIYLFILLQTYSYYICIFNFMFTPFILRKQKKTQFTILNISSNIFCSTICMYLYLSVLKTSHTQKPFGESEGTLSGNDPKSCHFGNKQQAPNSKLCDNRGTT